MPLRSVCSLRGLTRSPSGLAAKAKDVEKLGSCLKNEFLANKLAHEKIGAWSLDCDTINFLETQVHELKPSAVLEFGSGVSTICLAQFMAEASDDGCEPLVYSIEQNQAWIQNTQNMLLKCGLLRRTRIGHAPLSSQQIEGKRTVCYELSESFLAGFLESRRPELCLVDGPISSSGSRFGTIPLARHYLAEEARFLLDDAFRDGELEIANNWSRLPYIHVNGIHMFGKGLLVGRLRPK